MPISRGKSVHNQIQSITFLRVISSKSAKLNNYFADIYGGNSHQRFSTAIPAADATVARAATATFGGLPRRAGVAATGFSNISDDDDDGNSRIRQIRYFNLTQIQQYA